MILFLLLITTLFPGNLLWEINNEDALKGAWETSLPDGSQGLLIVTDEHFSATFYRTGSPEFLYTEGGKWTLKENGTIDLLWEYHSDRQHMAGKKENLTYDIEEDLLTIAETKWEKIDNGEPGELNGAWLITGRQRDGELNPMTPGARKTMKILSGTRFQWIAYNSETGEFFGTGGGKYTTENGKYTENIDFFSRDNSRVGASLEFDYDLKDGKWHHSGKSSKGDPIYEIWSDRKSLGI